MAVHASGADLTMQDLVSEFGGSAHTSTSARYDPAG